MKRRIYGLLHIFFIAIAPVALILIQYGAIENTTPATAFKLSFGGIILLALVFFLVKSTILDRKIEDMRAQVNTMLADLKTEQDEGRKAALEREIGKSKAMEAILNAILPSLLLFASYIATTALEAQVARLSATLGFISISFVLGVTFGILHAKQPRRKGGSK